MKALKCVMLNNKSHYLKPTVSDTKIGLIPSGICQPARIALNGDCLNPAIGLNNSSDFLNSWRGNVFSFIIKSLSGYYEKMIRVIFFRNFVVMKIYFIHIPKTGGSSIISALKNSEVQVIGHDIRDPLYKLPKYIVGPGDQAFALTRNPVERCISAYYYLRRVEFQNMTIMMHGFLTLRNSNWNSSF